MFYGISFADIGPGLDQGSELQVEVNLVKVETQVTCPVSVAQALVLPTVVLHQSLNAGEYTENFYVNQVLGKFLIGVIMLVNFY